MARRTAPPTEAEVTTALSNVRDPELDEPITDLGFVVSVDASDEQVEVALRLPTFFCAPNFAYLMVSDAHAAVIALPGVARARVRLVDHLADEQISAGVDGQAGFARTFDGLTEGNDLEELRATFARKAYLARTHEVCQQLLAAGHDIAALVEFTVAALPEGSATRRFLERRTELGMSIAATSPLLLDVWGAPVSADDVTDHLRRARTVHVSIEGNAGLCRGLLETRYARDGTGSEDGRIGERAHQLIAADNP